MFSSTEAVSIWVGLVNNRRREIDTGINEAFVPAAALFASQITVSMEQLADWDNSARAWIRRGDEIKKKERIQQILIFNNLDASVNVKSDTYTNVIQVWNSALCGMENLLHGQSQNIQDGSLLLALSSWHLYPDMIVSSTFFLLFPE